MVVAEAVLAVRERVTMVLGFALVWALPSEDMVRLGAGLQVILTTLNGFILRV